MKVNKRLLAFFAEEEAEVVEVVVEKVLAEGAGAEGVFEEGEVGFKVGVAVGVVFADLVAGKMEGGGLVEAICQPVSGGLAPGGVAAPAAGGHPLAAVAGGVGVDGDQADVAFPQLAAPGVDALDAGAERDVVFFRGEELGVIAAVLEVLDDGGGDFAGVAPFVVAAVRGVFAGCVGAVAVIDEDLHMHQC